MFHSLPHVFGDQEDHKVFKSYQYINPNDLSIYFTVNLTELLCFIDFVNWAFLFHFVVAFSLILNEVSLVKNTKLNS